MRWRAIRCPIKMSLSDGSFFREWHFVQHSLDRLVRPQGSMDKPQSISRRYSALRALTGGYLNGTLRVLFLRSITTHENVVQSLRCRALSNT